MRVHGIQHVPFEGPGYIQSWMEEHGHPFSMTHFFEGQSLPAPSGIDALIVLGGPMSVFDEEQYPWMAAEKRFIKDVMDAGKKVLGICLGAQLIANVLGAAVKPAPNKEIGWFPVSPTEESKVVPWFHGLFSDDPVVFHWHADKFELPYGAINLASSAANKNQAFAIGDQLLGLQFHVETTPEGVAALIENAKAEIIPGTFVQSEPELAAGIQHAQSPKLCHRVLEGFFSDASG